MSNQGPAFPEPLAFPDPSSATNIRYNPSIAELRALAAADETTTAYGAASYVSEFRSRSGAQTKTAVDEAFTDLDYEIIETARAFVADADNEVLCLDRRLGTHPEASYVCRLYVPTKYARIALAWGEMLDSASGAEPDFVTVQLPDHGDVAIRVLPDEGVTVVIGSDYTGEAKKSFLRQYMWRVKQQGGLGLHAGSKRVRIERDGELTTVGQLFFGLSATGKSTLTSHGLWLDGDERAEMVQDDVCALLPDGTVAGSEGKGLYIKTIGLCDDDQPELYRAVTDDSAIMENVDVAADGTVDFDSDCYTSNGRAVVQRDCLAGASDDIDLDSVDQLFFITRNPLVPPIAKLTPDQAAVAFMLGESIETSAGDPSRAGEHIRVVGTNPFIIGSKGEEGNRFRDLIADLDVECYLLNTGTVGLDAPVDVGVAETVTLLREVARGNIEWELDESLGLLVPASVPGMDIGAFRVADHTDDADAALRELRAERIGYLATFKELDRDILDAVY